MSGEPSAAFVLGGFGIVALLLATVGIYGVLGHAVARRTHEIGVRLALGARHPEVVRLLVGDGMLLVGTGVALGLIGSYALTGVSSSLLFGVSPTDLATFIAVPLLLAAVALVACYLPARRATTIDPLLVLRHE